MNTPELQAGCTADTGRMHPGNKRDAETDQIDGRTKLGRRHRALVKDLTDELGGNLTTAESALVGLAAAVIIRTEQLQVEITSGRQTDDTQLVRLTNAVGRLLKELTAQKAKRAKDGPSALQQWLDARAAQEDEADEADAEQASP